MNATETSRILACITAVYPAFLNGRDPEILQSVWEHAFAGVPYGEVNQALLDFIALDTKGFPPVPGALRQQIIRRRELSGMTEGDAWALVRRAASNSIYSSVEEFRKLPPGIRRIVGDAAQLREWAMQDSRTLETVIAPVFKRAWRERRQLENELGPCLSEGEQLLRLDE